MQRKSLLCFICSLEHWQFSFIAVIVDAKKKKNPKIEVLKPYQAWI
jgi:hypothetical protein